MARYAKWAKQPKWLKVVRMMPCVAPGCGASGMTDAHHGGGGSGMGMTSPDCMAIPLCHPCHMRHHDAGVPSLEFCQEWLEEFFTSAGVEMPSTVERGRLGVRGTFAAMAPKWAAQTQEWLDEARGRPEECAENLQGLFMATMR